MKNCSKNQGKKNILQKPASSKKMRSKMVPKNAPLDNTVKSKTNGQVTGNSDYKAQSLVNAAHKVLTYVEYRTVSGVFQNIDSPPPLRPASVSSPRTKGRGGGIHTRQGVRGWGVNILGDARHWIGLL
jgi:hypothetical protein